MRARRLARFYTPLICLIALIAVNLWLYNFSFDPLTAAQNPRLQFQTDQTSSEASNLTSKEQALVQDVVRPSADWGSGSPRILYSGNSQTLAIMDRLPADLTSPQWLQVLLSRGMAPKSPVVRLGSLPNLSMTEFLVKVVAAGEQPSGGPDFVVLGLVLDGWRFLSIREDLNSVAQSPQVTHALANLAVDNPDLALADNVIIPSTQGTSKVQESKGETDQRDLLATRVEANLQNWAEGHVPLFSKRSDLQSQVFLQFFSWRNVFLGINTTTARPIPETNYLTSRQLLELCLRYARAKKITMVIYLAPIRPIEPNPNLPENVTRFRQDIPTLCRQYGITCLDYTNLVPEKLWTNYPDDAAGSAGQRDFAHFTGAAHKLLAEHLMSDVGSLILAWENPLHKEAQKP